MLLMAFFGRQGGCQRAEVLGRPTGTRGCASPQACTQSLVCSSSHKRVLLSPGLQWHTLCMQSRWLATGQLGRLQSHMQQISIARAVNTTQMHVMWIYTHAKPFLAREVM